MKHSDSASSPGGDLDVIDRAAPLLGMVALLLGTASLLSYLYPQLQFAGCVAFLGLCMGTVALVKRHYLIGGLASAVCLLVLGLAMTHPPSSRQGGYLITLPERADEMRSGSGAAYNPPASI